MQRCNVPGVDLHPRDVVDQFHHKHAVTLSTVARALDGALQVTFARHEEDYPDPKRLPGDALCSGARSALWAPRSVRSFSAGSLDVAKRPPASKQLIDPETNETVRLRRYPWDYKQERRVTLTASPDWTLFGDVLDRSGYELVLLWQPDYGRKALDAVYLSAVAGLDSNYVAIYHQTQIEPAAAEVIMPATETSDADYLAEFLPNHSKFGDDPSSA